jgi:hypothetical protein
MPQPRQITFNTTTMNQPQNPLIICLLAFLLVTLATYAQESVQDAGETAAEYTVAPVTLDGNTLFRVRGISVMPAKERAANISRRIKAAAADARIHADSIKLAMGEQYTGIIAGSVTLMEMYDADAALEGVGRSVLAESTRRRISRAIAEYRLARSRPELINKTIRAIIATVILALILIVIVYSVRRLNRYIQKKIEQKIKSVESISFKLIQSKQMWKVFHLLFDTLKVIVVFLVLIFISNTSWACFPGRMHWQPKSWIYSWNRSLK